MTTRNPVWVEQDYRFRKDDGTLSTATYYAAQNTSASIPKNDTFRLRVNIGDTNNANASNVTAWKLQFAVNGGAWTDVGAATAVQYATSANVTDGTNETTQRLSAITGATYNTSFMEFDSNNTLTSRTWADDYTEYEFCLAFGSVSASDTVTFRVVTTGGTAPTITNTPTLTVLASAYLLSVTPETFTLTGSSATTTYVAGIFVTPATFNITGSNAALVAFIEKWDSVTWDAFYWDEIRLQTTPGSLTLTGYSADLSKGSNLNNYVLDTTPGSYSLTGASAQTLLARLLGPDAGSYTLTGSDGTLLLATTLSVSPASYTALGESASLLRTSLLATDPGSYSLTGSSATLTLGTAIAADPGSYALTGSDASLLRASLVTTSPGSYAATGASATLTRDLLVSVDPGSFTVTGSDAALLVKRVLSSLAGELAITGSDGRLLSGRLSATSPGSYAVTGATAALEYSGEGKQIDVIPGAFDITGADATLAYSGDEGGGTGKTGGFIENVGSLMGR